MKKRLLSLILTGVLGVSLLTGCAGKQEAAKEPETRTEEQPTEETKEEPRESTPEEPEAEVTGRPQLIVAGHYGSVSMPDSDNYESLQNWGCETLLVSPECRESFPALDKALNQAANEELASVQKSVDEADAVGAYKENPEMFEGTTWENNREMTVLRSDSCVVSARCDFYDYMGGAHGMYGNFGYNYEVATGEKITADKAFTDKGKLFTLLRDKLYTDYKELKEEFDEMKAEDTLKSVVSGESESELEFTLEPCSVSFYFTPYTFATYASGAQDLVFTYDELSGVIDEKYVPDPEEPYITRSGFLDLDEDGDLDRLYAYVRYEDGNEYEGRITISVNNDESELELSQYSIGYDADLYVVRTAGGKNFVLVRGSVENDYGFMTVCGIEGGKLVEKDTLWYTPWWTQLDDQVFAGYELTDPDAIPLGKHMDFMATYRGQKLYHMADDGSLSSDDKYYMIPGEMVLHTQCDVKADEVDEDGKVLTEGVEVPSGSDIVLYRTNGNYSVEGDALVDAYLNNKNGKLLRFHFTKDYPHQINGVPEEDLFESLYYAG